MYAGVKADLKRIERKIEGFYKHQEAVAAAFEKRREQDAEVLSSGGTEDRQRARRSGRSRSTL
jgi:hypothetical protein